MPLSMKINKHLKHNSKRLLDISVLEYIIIYLPISSLDSWLVTSFTPKFYVPLSLSSFHLDILGYSHWLPLG